MKNQQLLEIKKNCFFNAPWYLFKENHLDLFLAEKLQPEIGLEGTCLYDESPEEFRRIATLLKENQLACTLHAPFFDLAPGALDPFILEKTRHKLHQAFELISLFQPKSIVCHLQYEENKHGYVFDTWYSTFLATYTPLVEICRQNNVTIMFENTYERDPEVHLKVLKHFSSPHVKFCLDVGHLLAFSKTCYTTWLPTLSPWLGQLHLHDNHGATDEHLAPGQGTFNFIDFFGFLRKNKLRPLLTFEPHSEEDLRATLDYLLATNLLEGVL